MRAEEVRGDQSGREGDVRQSRLFSDPICEIRVAADKAMRVRGEGGERGRGCGWEGGGGRGQGGKGRLQLQLVIEA